MRIPLLALVLLLALDAALYSGLRQRSGERADLARRREELAARAGSRNGTGERSQRIQDLLRAGSESMGGLDRPLDIAEIRDLLVGAERGLAIDRFSLDFRPEQGTERGMEGGRVAASLGGSFEAVSAYLARVENLHLPLAPSALSLRQEDFGRVVLTIEWKGVWSQETRALDELSVEDIGRLEKWLRSEPFPPPKRNLFSPGAVSAEPETPPPGPRTRVPAPPSPLQNVKLSPSPKLTGFVMARPELEAEVSRRVLAAIRFEDKLFLVGLGDPVGSYRVDEINARESVLLVHQETGERLKLVLE